MGILAALVLFPFLFYDVTLSIWWCSLFFAKSCVLGKMQLHGDMCKELSGVLCKVLSIFPSLEGARPRSKSGIQALCSLHIALEKAKNILQHCSECSKLYLVSCSFFLWIHYSLLCVWSLSWIPPLLYVEQAITGDAVLLKFEKAKSALIDSLRRVEDIVPSSIGSQVMYISVHTKSFLLQVNKCPGLMC